MTGEPIIFYNFALPSVHPMLPCYYVGSPLSFFLSLSLCRSLERLRGNHSSQQSSLARYRYAAALYIGDDHEEISGTSFVDQQIRLVLTAEKSIITTCISRRGSKGFGNDFLADVFRGETESRSEIPRLDSHCNLSSPLASPFRIINNAKIMKDYRRARCSYASILNRNTRGVFTCLQKMIQILGPKEMTAPSRVSKVG